MISKQHLGKKLYRIFFYLWVNIHLNNLTFCCLVGWKAIFIKQNFVLMWFYFVILSYKSNLTICIEFFYLNRKVMVVTIIFLIIVNFWEKIYNFFFFKQRISLKPLFKFLLRCHTTELLQKLFYMLYFLLCLCLYKCFWKLLIFVYKLLYA